MFPLLLRQPFVEIGPVVDVENVMIAVRKDRQLRMAASGFRGINQFFDLLERRELIVCSMKQPEWDGCQLLRPGGDRD